MPNEDMQQLEAAFADLMDDAESMASDRRGLYKQRMRQADREWAEAHAIQQELAPAIEAGIATDEMQQEYLLEGSRKRRMLRLYQDRSDSHALAELPGASLPVDRIQINDSKARIE